MTESKQAELLPERIVEAVWKHVERYSNGEIWMDTLRAEAEVKRLLRTHSPAQAEWCHWVFDDDDDSTMWETSCGNAFQFFDGGPSDNKAKFCQYCGKPIEESRTSDFNEDAQQND